MPRAATRVTSHPDYPASRVMPGALARLVKEDWTQMTAAALQSPNHVSGMERWRKLAREQNPALDEDQAERLAGHLRREHYRRMGRLSAQARKIAREAEAELGRADGAA